MEIRHAAEQDLPRIMEIYAYARRFMAEHGNPRQWGPTNWPPEALIREDIRVGKSYVCEQEGRVIGCFYYDFGEDIEPTYRNIDGAWLADGAYGVVHRIASADEVKGTGSFMLRWALRQSPHMRVDTHGDNTVMQSFLEKNGFVRCGVIHVVEDNDPRLAYEKLPE